MDSTSEIDQEIKYYLERCTATEHMAGCLDMVPEQNKRAIYNMICDAQYNRVHKSVIALNVCEDVSAILEDREPQFSKPFLNNN